VAHGPVQLDEVASPKVGIDGPGTVCDVHGLGYEVCASRNLRMGGRRGSSKLCSNWCAWVQAMREQTRELLEPMAEAAPMINGH
jgi:hypothetical protein